MTTVTSNPLADALKHDAPRFNSRFERAAAQMPRLDPNEFATFLRQYVGPIAQSVAAIAPDRVFPAVEALYRVALQTIGRELPQRCPEVLQLWHIFSQMPNLMAQDAAAVASLATNVTINLADMPGTRVKEFVTVFSGIAPQVESVNDLRSVLTILAWRTGYAHAREAALDTAASLEPSLTNVLLSRINPGRFRTDPWLRPEDLAGQQPARALRIAARPGGFRGFGGPFLKPPTVARYDGQFVLTDGEAWCSLAADAFGATLRRLETAPKTLPQPVSQQWRVSVDGQVAHGTEVFQAESLLNGTSWAADDTTLVITTALSHRAYVIARLPVERKP